MKISVHVALCLNQPINDTYFKIPYSLTFEDSRNNYKNNTIPEMSEPAVDWNIFESVTEDFESEDWLFLLTQEDLLGEEILDDSPILQDNPSIVLEECGQNSSDWLEFISHFPSAKLYNNRVLHFIEWMILREERQPNRQCFTSRLTLVTRQNATSILVKMMNRLLHVTTNLLNICHIFRLVIRLTLL